MSKFYTVTNNILADVLHHVFSKLNTDMLSPNTPEPEQQELWTALRQYGVEDIIRKRMDAEDNMEKEVKFIYDDDSILKFNPALASESAPHQPIMSNASFTPIASSGTLSGEGQQFSQRIGRQSIETKDGKSISNVVNKSIQSGRK